MGEDARAALKERILRYPRWYHSFQLDAGTKVVGWAESTRCYPDGAYAEAGFSFYRLPADATGLAVLDIGGWDGVLSFEMERRGASEVVLVNPGSLDDMDLPLSGPASRPNVEAKYRAAGYPLEDPYSGGARLIREWLGSRVEIVDSGLYGLPDRLAGRAFDLVLFLGLLYHLRDPVRGLEAAARLTRPGGTLVLETMCMGQDDPLAEAEGPLCRYAGGDAGQVWWVPNHAAIAALLGSCGFAGVTRLDASGVRCLYHATRQGGA